MKSKAQSTFGVHSRFKSLPDGRRVFLAHFPWSGSYILPDDSTEQQLQNKIRWANLFLLISMVVIVGGVWFFRSFLGPYLGGTLPVTFFLLAAMIRWALYRNDLRNLQKIDYHTAIASFFNTLSLSLRSYSKNSLPNYEISALLDILNSNDKVIMLKYTESFPNILRCRLDGSIVWQAELPTPDDVYTNVEWKDQKLHAFTRSSRSVLLDENTGRILSTESDVGQNSA
jgi:hypothetical protein